MTPKAKAKKIRNLMLKALTKDGVYNPKRYALIAINLILNDVGAKNWEGDVSCDGKNYWKEVKKELELL